MGPGERKRLFDQAREYSTREHMWTEADRLWVKVIDAYRDATRQPGPVDSEDRRQLARALWRRAMLLSALGRPGPGMTPGREAVTVFEQLNDAARGTSQDPAAPRRDEALAELITAVVDVAEIAFAAGQPAARVKLLERAIAAGLLSVGSPLTAGPRTREAMGTAYHNQATALLHLALIGAAGEEGPTEAALAASRACELRQGLLDPTRPLSFWEMANTYGVYAQCLVLIHDFDRARMVLKLGNRLVGTLGPAGAEPALKLRVATEMLSRERAAAGTKSRRWGWRRR